MKQSALWILVIIVAVLFILVYSLDVAKNDEAPSSAATTTAALPSLTATYYCQGGATIAATFKQDSAGIILSDGRSFDLPVAVSASGARYEVGANTPSDVVFWTKGNGAFITENGKTTYDNCVAGTAAASSAASGVTTFTDAGKLFTFSYPTSLSVSGSQVGYTQDWAVNATTSGMLLAEIIVPKSTQPMTNFGDAKFTIGVSSDPDAVKTCLSSSAGNPDSTTSNVTINGVAFTKMNSSDAGAGNFYETTSYRTVRDNECYAVEYTIHSSNIGNYSPDQGIKPFDEAKIKSILEGMAESFSFLK